jgi:multidrug efflux pump
MLAARWLRPEHEERRFALVDKAMHQFDRLAHAYARALDWVMRAPGWCCWSLRAAAAHRAAVLGHPQEPVPGAGHRADQRHDVAAPDVSFARMAQLQQQVAAALLADPAVASLQVGVDGINPTLNQGAWSST